MGNTQRPQCEGSRTDWHSSCTLENASDADVGDHLALCCGLSIDGESKIDPTKPTDNGFQRIAAMTVLMIDEASMIDDRTWLWLRDQLSSVGAAAPRNTADKHPDEDAFGRVHIIVAMDLKQLPRPPRTLLS